MAKLPMNTRNIVLIISLILIFLPSKSNVESTVIATFLLLPLLLLKLGLAAPLILLLLAKLILLFLKKKAILTAILLASKKDSQENDGFGFGLFNGEGTGAISNGLSALGNLARIKRSTNLVQQVIGEKIHINEEQLLETILSLDTKRCGEKLLCEVASAQRLHKLTTDEVAMFILFSDKELATKNSSKALKVYRKALIHGFKQLDCTVRYPTCPYKKREMVDLMQLITGSEFTENLFPTYSNRTKPVDDVENEEIINNEILNHFTTSEKSKLNDDKIKGSAKIKIIDLT